MRLYRMLVAVAVLVFTIGASATETEIGLGDFSNAKVLDFEALTGGPISTTEAKAPAGPSTISQTTSPSRAR